MLLTEINGLKYYDSSNILISDYDEENEILYLTFDKGAIFKYFGVTKEINEEFIKAESQGLYFNDNIKSEYSYEKYKTLLKEEVLGVKSLIKNIKKQM